MNKRSSNSLTHYPSIAIWSIRALSLVAILISGYLAFASFQSEGPAGCGGSSIIDCDHVLRSRWSKWFVIPVSLPAVFVYACILTTSFVNRTNDSAQLILFSSSLAVGLAAIWFAGLQLFVIHKLCLYCLAVHSCGLAIALISICSLKGSSTQPSTSKTLVTSVCVAFGAFLLLAVGQIVATPSGEFVITESGDTEAQPPAVADFADLRSERTTTLKPPIPQHEGNSKLPQDSDLNFLNESATTTKHGTSSAPLNNSATTNQQNGILSSRVTTTDRTIKILKGRQTVFVKDHPIIGDPNTPELFVKLFDYTCPDCRRLHGQLERFQKKRSEPIAVLLMPVPMNKKCNPYVIKDGNRHVFACELARIAIAIWMEEPTRFAKFHHWMMESSEPPSLPACKEMGRRILGGQRFENVISSSEVNRRLDYYTKIYRAAGAKVIPKLFVRDRLIVGTSQDDARIMQALSQLLH